ncbi:sugar phosphate isomerase/epimerase family protein [Muriicola sp. Z0-33]|uniref:sugar phosphate isomerase/epimerase family protein n=1 Tax=Muriicola sp. Z0-33 TaxID=2816957 RepID=UPI002238D11A|nr:sugar phosphate isomerase/epimerase [Muriicola sp. Z0-33]MCW5516866.1 TIM barrel protein [Muriicola sp. Z0-33]
MRRRKFIKASSAGVLSMTMPLMPIPKGILADTRFGVAEASYLMRWYRKMESTGYPPFTSAMEMLEHCGELGFGGIQVGIRNWDKSESKQLRSRSEALEMFLEGQIRLPKDQQDTDRFEADILSAKRAGISIVRAACLSGRRYETFDTLEAFKKFKAAAINSIFLAEPIVRKHKIKLAVENHKDWRINEFLEILKHVGSQWVGITLDTGNNISLLEDPMEVVKELAPYSFSVHLKDMAVEEYDDGFLMSEVNLGEGYLDIEEMIRIIKKEQPNIRFNLEMITRDPLKIPCLTDKYWATFEDISAKELGTYLRSIRSQKSRDPLPLVSDKSNDDQLKLEVENNRTSLIYAKQNLGFN